MQLSKNKILVAMAQNNYSTKDLAKAYGVSCSRINFILNSREVRPTTVAKLSKAGIPKGTYNRITTTKTAKAVTIGKIARILNVDVTELLED